MQQLLPVILSVQRSTKIFLVLITIYCAAMASQGTAMEVGWRNSEKDGLNCAYLFLASHGAELSYADLEKQFTSLGKSPSVLDIKEIIESYDINVEVIRCAPNDARLFESPPAISLLYDARADGSSYVLLVEPYTKAVIVVLGDVVAAGMDIDDFRRSWSGVAIVKAADGPLKVWRWVAIVTLILAAICTYSCFRNRKPNCT